MKLCDCGGSTVPALEDHTLGVVGCEYHDHHCDLCHENGRCTKRACLNARARDFSDDVYAFRNRRQRAPAHYHGCPECYEPEACVMDCTIEPDLGLHKGAPLGGYDICSTCRKRGVVDAEAH